MSLADTVSGNGLRRKKINVSEVRVNKLNFYNKEIVDSMAMSIAVHGQLSNATVFMEEGKDGKLYTLIDGETRYLAICQLVVEGKHDGSFDVVIRPKEQRPCDVEEILMDANLQRTKTKEERIMEIKKADELYEIHKKNNQIPTGMLKSDWIGMKIGLTGRQVRNYLKEFKGDEDKNSKKDNDQDSEVTNKKIIKKVKSINRHLNTILSEIDCEIEEGNNKLSCLYHELSLAFGKIQAELARIEERKR